MKKMMEIKEAIEKIAKLKEGSVGPTEENVKQKIVVPLLELLGHEREDLEFEHRTKSGQGKMDILIKNVPPDCKVIIDTKNYTESLSDHIDQIKDYTFDEAALFAVLVNGTEIRIYSPLRGVAFERSLLYSLERQDLTKKSVWTTISNLLHKDNLEDRSAIEKIEEREREIKGALSDEEDLRQNYDNKIEGINSGIESKEEEIELLRTEVDNLEKGQDAGIAKIWDSIGLPIDLFRIPPRSLYEMGAPIGTGAEYPRKAGRVTLRELVDAGLVKDGQTLYFYHTQLFRDEQAQILASSNKLKYGGDGRVYSISEIAKVLLIKYGFKRDEHGVAGPQYWKTKEERLLHDLNEEVRRKRGDRK